MLYRELAWTGVQPLVLCVGQESDVETSSDESRFFLHVVGKPLFCYVLELLQHSKYSKHNEVIIAVPEGKGEEVELAKEKFKLEITLNVREFQSSCSTASILRTLRKQNLLKAENTLVLPGDLFGDIDLCNVIAEHRLKCATVTSAYAGVPGDVKVPGQKSNIPAHTELVGIDAGSHRIVILNEEKIRSKALVYHPSIELKKLSSCHVFCIRTCVLDYLLEKDSFDDFEEDFLPFLVKQQYRKPAADHDQEGGIHSFIPADDEWMKVMSLSATSPHDVSIGGLSCYAVVLNSDCFRINSIMNYVNANKQMLSRVTEEADKSQNLIGEHCTIPERARISNSILAREVTMGEGSSLTDCLVFRGVTIGERSHLKDCLVEAGVKIPPGTKATGQTFERDDI